MKLHHIRYFLALSESLSFTQAAKSCHVSQPALTKAIQSLEEEVGAELIRREGKHSHLTPVGKLLRDEFRKLEAGMDEAVSIVRRDISLEKSHLNVAIMRSFGPAQFTKLLSEYNSEFPGVKIILRDISQADAVDTLLDGRTDCVFFADNGLVDHTKLNVMELMTEKFVVAFEASHRFSQLKSVDALTVAAEPYIERLHCEARPRFLQFLADNEMQLQLVYCSEREDWIQALIANGNGVCMLPEHSICRDDIQYRPVVNPVMERRLQLLTVKDRKENPALASFMKFASDWYAENAE
jgi:DNA-binding transcriptional LysR family regulator